MGRRSSLFPAIALPPGFEASEARKHFEASSTILKGATDYSKALPSPDSLQSAGRIRDLSKRLTGLLERGINPTSVESIDDAANALVKECLAVQRLTIQARKTS